MKSLAVAAGAIHGLSLSIAYGGPVFAKAGLKRALRKVTSKDERRAVKQAAWKAFSKVNVPAHVGFTASWVIIRGLLRGLYLDRQTKRLLITKDVLIAGALLTGVAATINGRFMGRILDEKKSKTGTEAKPLDMKHYNRHLRLEKKLGRANMVFLAGSIIVGAAIGVGVVRSQRMSMLARLFNR